MDTTSGEYNEYFVARKPVGYAARIMKHYHTAMYKIAARRIPRLNALSIFEVGAGWGYFAEVCHKYSTNYKGIELNDDQAKNLRNQGFSVTAGRIPPFPQGPSSDVIWMSHVLEHNDGFMAAKEMLGSAFQHLPKHGYVVVISPDILRWKGEFWNVDWSHGFPTTLKRVSQLLKETGFTVEFEGHTIGGSTQPLLVGILDLFVRLVPVSFIDFFLVRVTGKPLMHSFMTLLGFRQIYLIGRKY